MEWYLRRYLKVDDNLWKEISSSKKKKKKKNRAMSGNIFQGPQQ